MTLDPGALPTFLRLRFRVPASSCDDLCADLWARNPDSMLGVQMEPGDDDSGTIDVYFRSEPQPIGAEWKDRGVEPLEREWMPEHDWLADYRLSAQPIELGRAFLVDPAEPDECSRAASGARRLLRIPARRAFGTGSHESTRLAVAMLESIDLCGRRVLDVGSGSGILSFVALQLEASFVLGLDIDIESVFCSVENRRLNRLRPALLGGSVHALLSTALFDVVVVNILPNRILADLGEVTTRLRVGGDLLFSGVLVSQRQELVRALHQAGVAVATTISEGEWLGLCGLKLEAVEGSL